MHPPVLHIPHVSHVNKTWWLHSPSSCLCQSSVLGAGFGDLGQPKRTQPSAGAQILEQLKGPGLGPLPSSQAAPPVSTQGSNASIGRLPGLGAPVPPPSSSSWDIKASESNTTSLSSQFRRKSFRVMVVVQEGWAIGQIYQPTHCRLVCWSWYFDLFLTFYFVKLIVRLLENFT